MATFLQLALWNANCLHHHAEKLKTFLSLGNIAPELVGMLWRKEKVFPLTGNKSPAIQSTATLNELSRLLLH
jgi:hypothetical protein